MAGGFDAGQPLKGGVGDRRQAWEFIRRFAAEWTAPLAPGDGVSRDAWRAAEGRIGAELPAALREAYLLFGRRPDLTARQDRLVPPHQLSLDEPGTAVVFRVENQYCASWGVAISDLASDDPRYASRTGPAAAGSRSWTACRWRAWRWCSVKCCSGASTSATCASCRRA
jgi:hypothetical protein